VSERIQDSQGALADYLAILSRRRWLIVLPLVLVPLVALAISFQQTAKYQATAQVLLNRQNVVADATGANAGTPYVDPNRLAATQSDIARSPELVRRVIANAHVAGLTPGDVHGGTTIFPEVGADLLDFSFSAGDPEIAARVATAYAREYTIFRRQLDTAALKNAIKNVQRKIDGLIARGVKETSPLYTNLLDSQSKLETAATLQTANTTLLRPADGAAKVSPKPRRNAFLGAAIGLVLGLILAFLAEALDRNVRSDTEIEERLGIPLLGRLPAPGRKLRRAHGLVMLEEPHSVGAEAFRKLRTNIDFANLELGGQILLVTSALEQEGKSTTAANLAVAYARAGRRVALVDFDLRRPFVHRFFRRGVFPGVTDVIGGRTSFEGALQELALPPLAPPKVSRIAAPAAASTARVAAVEAQPIGNRKGAELILLPAGSATAADPADFLDAVVLKEMFGELRNRFDLVIVDAPPTLAVGDAMILSGAVDGLLIVVGKRGLPRPALDDLARQLKTVSAPRLGFALAGAVGAEYMGGYGYQYAYGTREGADTERGSARQAR
jgi:polysaccharide biosynthesis transport protein